MIIGEHHRDSVMLSAVARVVRTRDWKQVMVYTADGKYETFESTDFDLALQNTAQVSFAANGAVLLATTYDENMKPNGVRQKTIFGFYLDATGDFRAVTIDGNVNEFTVLFPDGHVEQFEERWDSLEDYERYLVETAEPLKLIGAD